MERVQILGCPVDNLTMDETINKITTAIDKKETIHHVVVNAAKLVNAQKDLELKKSIINCDIINADGQGVVWASRFLNKSLTERVAGIDLMENLVKISSKKGYKIFFFGAEESIVKGVADKYSTTYGNDIIAGYRNGYYSKEDELQIAQEIADSKADILFVAITSPKKEIFLETYKNILNIPFIMGVGGSFDVVAGKVKRAPIWMQKWGLEWFYRVLQEPKRLWKRYFTTNWKFLKLILMEKVNKLNHTEDKRESMSY